MHSPSIRPLSVTLLIALLAVVPGCGGIVNSGSGASVLVLMGVVLAICGGSDLGS